MQTHLYTDPCYSREKSGGAFFELYILIKRKYKPFWNCKLATDEPQIFLL